MSVDIFDLIVAQIEEQKGQDYVDYVLPAHRVRPGRVDCVHTWPVLMSCRWHALAKTTLDSVMYVCYVLT